MSRQLLCPCGKCHYCMDENVVRQMYGAKSRKESTLVYDNNGNLTIEICELLKPDTAKNRAGYLDDKLFCQCPISIGCEAADSGSNEESSLSLSFLAQIGGQKNSLFEGPTMTQSISRML